RRLQDSEIRNGILSYCSVHFLGRAVGKLNFSRRRSFHDVKIRDDPAIWSNYEATTLTSGLPLRVASSDQHNRAPRMPVYVLKAVTRLHRTCFARSKTNQQKESAGPSKAVWTHRVR